MVKKGGDQVTRGYHRRPAGAHHGRRHLNASQRAIIAADLAASRCVPSATASCTGVRAPTRKPPSSSTANTAGELAKVHAWRLIEAATFAETVSNWKLPLSSRESHIRPLLARLESDDRIADTLSIRASSRCRWREPGY